MDIFFNQLLPATFFLTTIYFHLARKNFGIAIGYGIQSLAIALILLGSFFDTRSLTLLFIIILLVTFKVIIAPKFFIGLVKKHEVKFSSSAYLNLPLSLIVISVLIAVVHSRVFLPLASLVPAHSELVLLAIAGMLVSLFLVINRKGALSPIVGVRSLENSLVTFAFFSGLEQSTALQVGIMFDIAVWFVIATVFVSMIYKHFGTLDITEMKQLRD